MRVNIEHLYIWGTLAKAKKDGTWSLPCSIIAGDSCWGFPGPLLSIYKGSECCAEATHIRVDVDRRPSTTGALLYYMREIPICGQVDLFCSTYMIRTIRAPLSLYEHFPSIILLICSSYHIHTHNMCMRIGLIIQYERGFIKQIYIYILQGVASTVSK